MNKKDTRLSGIDPLAYTGVFAESPPNIFSNNRAPTTQDRKNFRLGDFWVDRETLDAYFLAALSGGSATWIRIGTPITTVITFDCDTGSATQVDGEIDIFGGDLIDTSASGNTVTFALTNGTDGQLIIGGGTAPAWANLTSTGATITITNGPNTINLEAVGGATVLTQIDGDTGSATPTAGEIIVAGGTNMNTSAAASTLSVNLNDAVTLAGTLTLSALGAGVMQTNGSGLVTSNNGTNGQLLIGGGSAPAWANLTSTGGSVAITNGANSINIEGTGGGGIGTAGFSATQQNATSVFTATMSIRYLGTLGAMTELFDTGSDFNPGGPGRARFTAPQTGKYFLSVRIRFQWHRASSIYGMFITPMILTSNRNYGPIWNEEVAAGFGPSYAILNSSDLSTYTDMDAGDVADFGWRLNIALATLITIPGVLTLDPKTWVYGYLVE